MEVLSVEQSASFPFLQLPSQQASPLKGKFFPLKKDTILKSHISSIEKSRNSCNISTLLEKEAAGGWGCLIEHGHFLESIQ